MKRKKTINPFKIIGNHPITNDLISLKWYRGANRYNNGATRYGRKYEFRYIISSVKQKPYSMEAKVVTSDGS
ncbi:MAG: hypothetical protein JWR72_1819 [Flavisolibacter sp.]|jgi:hypothetical protein|nr:hypothetical protein [Flavisolibacter sp.]